MREPADESASERAFRRHGRGPRAADPAGQPSSAGERGRDQAAGAGGGRARREANPGGAAGGGRHSASRAVFTPDYTRAETDPDPHRRPAADGPGDPGRCAPSSQGHGRPGPTAARGPVRGYAPAPGQPPPIYPPGQFAAWNRRRDGQPGRAGQPGGQDGQLATGPASGQHAQPGRTPGAAGR
jgi:hypothetical protein